jgi:asparagine synthase (glutamine-hydrolysing)
MCGIAGIWAAGGGGRGSLHVLGDMLRVMGHRGPDDEGLYASGNVALGMRRLSIIDVCGGRQPLHSEDQAIVVICNGEIYNYLELREQLRRRGHSFATAGDTEVIAHLYEEEGVDCVHALRGILRLPYGMYGADGSSWRVIG